MKIAIYVRCSTTEQTTEQQADPCIARCVREGWEYTVFNEIGVSGSKTSRPVLDRMMGDIRRRGYQGLMVYKLDRLGRNLQHLLQLIEELNNKNVQFICLNPEVDTKSITGRFFLQIMGAVAELERSMTIERNRAKMDLMRRQGKSLGGRPKGSKDSKPRNKLGYLMRWHGKTQDTTY